MSDFGPTATMKRVNPGASEWVLNDLDRVHVLTLSRNRWGYLSIRRRGGPLVTCDPRIDPYWQPAFQPDENE